MAATNVKAIDKKCLVFVTGGRFSKNVVSLLHAEDLAVIDTITLAGGQIDAPEWIAAGACNANDVTNGRGAFIPYPSLSQRE